ncbi:MAG: methyltransferase, FxLD system [Anaerolineae bacterium]|nr:methyltransferase, FxLD system [Anaerolineae bacterium]
MGVQFDYDHGDAWRLNQVLVDTLRTQGFIHTQPVEEAFRTVLRHPFLPGQPCAEVYANQSIAIKVQGDEVISSSSQPAIMATMLEQLALEPGHKVLEIGTGSGYNAALIAHIVGATGQVITVDIDQDLADAAREHLAAVGAHCVQVVCADGGYGYARAAPYDRIILSVGAWDIAPAWWEQLKPRGRLVLPLSLPGGQKSIAFEQQGDHLSSRSVMDCGFVNLRGAVANPHPGRRVQLGPEPGLEAWCGAEVPLVADKAYGWLTGPRVDWETNVEVAVCEVIGGLGMWLALREPNMARLAAWDELVTSDIVPPLYGLGQARKVVFSPVLVGEGGLAALMRPPGQAAPLTNYSELFAPGPSFPLFVRQFGTDEGLARRLIDHIRAWDAANRPSTKRLRVRAYRLETERVPPEGKGSIVVEKQWTQLVLDWPAVIIRDGRTCER